MRGGNWHAAPGTGSLPEVYALDIALNTGFPLYILAQIGDFSLINNPDFH